MPNAVPVRVLMALEPRMYREAIAFALRKARPSAEVVVSSAGELSAEVARLEPHLVIANRVPGPVRRSGAFWLEVSRGGRMGAEISADGYSGTVEELSIEDLVAAVDRAGDELADS